MIRPKRFWPRMRWRLGVLGWHAEAVAIASWLSIETIEAAGRTFGLRW